MKKAMNRNRLINGTHGKVWWDGEKIGNVKSFQAKVTLNYEEVNQSEELTPGQKYMGFAIAGTLTMNKIDSFTADKMEDAIKSGIIPEATLIGALEDPAAYGYERVELTGVTFDEMTLMDFEINSLKEEELPFKATGFRYLDKII